MATRPLDLQSLRYFVAVIEAGSLTRATNALYIAQPALTARIKSLESELGVQLLERSHAGIKPTATGLRLYTEAVRLLAAADALRARVGKPPGEPEGLVTLAFPAVLVPTLLGQVLLAVSKRHPKIRLFVIDDVSLAIQSAVQDGRADFGLLVDPAAVAGLSVRRVAVESIYFVGLDYDGSVRGLLRTPSARKVRQRGPGADPTIPFASAGVQPLIMQSRRYEMRRKADEAAAAHGVRLNIVHEHDSANVILALCGAGAGFSFAPACAAPTRFEGPAGIRARVVNPEFVRAYSVSWLTGRRLSVAARAVIQILRSEVGAAIDQGRWSARHVDRPDYQFD